MNQIIVEIKWGDKSNQRVGIKFNKDDINLQYEDWYERYWKPAIMMTQNVLQRQYKEGI